MNFILNHHIWYSSIVDTEWWHRLVIENFKLSGIDSKLWPKPYINTSTCSPAFVKQARIEYICTRRERVKGLRWFYAQEKIASWKFMRIIFIHYYHLGPQPTNIPSLTPFKAISTLLDFPSSLSSPITLPSIAQNVSSPFVNTRWKHRF